MTKLTNKTNTISILGYLFHIITLASVDLGVRGGFSPLGEDGIRQNSARCQEPNWFVIGHRVQLGRQSEKSVAWERR